jgi:glycosyltransferase involved in cell wall biosynthesis
MLAHQVDNLALVTYVKPFKRHYQYEREVFNGLKNATWLNGPFSDCPAFLPATHVNVLLNRARCGLILSAEEGANYASTQYLLAGLPVITTASIGGREAFFDERYTFHVDSDSASVVQSVRRANQQLFDRQAIRNSALLIIERHRAVLGSYIEQMLKDYHIFINWKIVWKSAFINKMAVPQSLEAVRALAASCL